MHFKYRAISESRGENAAKRRFHSVCFSDGIGNFGVHGYFPTRYNSYECFQRRGAWDSRLHRCDYSDDSRRGLSAAEDKPREADNGLCRYADIGVLLVRFVVFVERREICFTAYPACRGAGYGRGGYASGIGGFTRRKYVVSASAAMVLSWLATVYVNVFSHLDLSRGETISVLFGRAVLHKLHISRRKKISPRSVPGGYSVC